MLSMLPGLLFLAPFSASLIRFALAITFGYAAWTHSSKPDSALRALALVEAGTAAAVIGGAWTQVAGIVGALIIAVWLFAPTTRLFPRSTALLAFVMSLSLIVTGAGAIAFDFPL